MTGKPFTRPTLSVAPSFKTALLAALPFILFATLLATQPAAAEPTGSPGPGLQGYWSLVDGSGDYDAYLKVQGDSGYYCFMDGKSSFRFKVVGDSITTPMNGKDVIALTTPTTLRISGSEKGVPYHSDFRSMDATGYPKACIDEEAEWYGPTSLSGPDSRRTTPAREAGPMGGHPFLRVLAKGRWVDLLGRVP